MKPILIPLPHLGFDPSEAAIPWKLLSAAGERVVFATPDGQPASADPLMVSGEGLDLWGWVPGLRKLKLVGLFLRADANARAAYRDMLASEAFRNPIAYRDIQVAEFDAVLLPGGHAKSMRPYLEDPLLQQRVAEFMESREPGRHKPVAAVCHGVLVLARSQGRDGRSIVADRQLTALTWAFEHKAWQLGRVMRFWEPHYYRTYLENADEPCGYWGVEQEIKRALSDPAQFQDVPRDAEHYRLKTDGLHRDNEQDPRPAWVVRDGNLVTARWPGDAHGLAKTFLQTLADYRTATGSDKG